MPVSSLGVTPRQGGPERILVEVASYLEHLTQYSELCRVRNDRRILRVLRSQFYTSTLDIERFDGRFVADHRNYDVTRVGGWLALYDDYVAVEDAGVTHRVALDTQREQLYAAKLRAHRQVGLDVFNRFTQRAGRNTPQKRYLHRGFRVCWGIGKAIPTRPVSGLDQLAHLDQGVEVGAGRLHRFEAESFLNFTDRRWVAGQQPVANEAVNALPCLSRRGLGRHVGLLVDGRALH